MAIQIDGDGIPLASLAPAAQASLKSGRKNLIINGGMQVAQRSTSTTWSSGSGYRTIDRWCSDWSLNGSMTQEQSTDAPEGFGHSLKCTVASSSTDSMTGAGAEYFTLRHPFEGYDCAQLNYGTSNAKKVTLSFWVKASTAATYSAGFRGDFTGGTYGNHQSFTISAANTWEYKTLTFNGLTTDTFSNPTTSKGMEIHIALACSVNIADTTDDGNWNAGNYIGLNSGDSTIGNFPALSAGETFYITGVQLELGDTATDFEHRSYGEELTLCQRYYQKMVNGRIMVGNNGGGTAIIGNIYLQQSMRTNPTVTAHGGGTAGGNFSIYSGGTGTQLSYTMSSSNVSVGISGNAVLGLNITGASAFPDGHWGWIDLHGGQLELFFDAEV